eukprot:UN09992
MSSQNNEMVNRLAFVGNLPPDATAEEMKQLCSQVGEVILFRIVYDRETGKPKGYGFCEYRDPKLVDAAVDLLHGFEHRGISLYVRRANQDRHSHNNNISMSMGNNQLKNSNNKNNNSNKKFMQQKKKKKASSSKRKTVDEITRVVQSFSTSEKREILSQMKLLIQQNEKGAKEILLENPQLAQALLLIQMEFNLVKTQDINALTQNVSNKQIITPQNTPRHTPKHTPKKTPDLINPTNTIKTTNTINTNVITTNNEQQQDVEMSETDKVNENRLK